MRIELTTSSLPRKCSTTELQQHSANNDCKYIQHFPNHQIDRYFSLKTIKNLFKFAHSIINIIFAQRGCGFAITIIY